MVGDGPQALADAREELRAFGLAPRDEGGRALDLGASLGFHTVAIAELGYTVVAVDSCAQWLDQQPHIVSADSRTVGRGRRR